MSIGPQTSPQRLGKYELQERLGQSSMAEVWKAFDTQSHRYVAIKLFNSNLQTDSDFPTRFQRQAQVIASLHHPNIVQCQDFSTPQQIETKSTPAYLVTEYVEGETLANYIHNTAHNGKFLPAADIVRLWTPIVMAFDYAHQHGVVHGNIKPANILLDKRKTSSNPMGEPIVTDFGMTKLIGVAAGSANSWRVGTPLYVAPEQVMGSPGDERSDIYSLGIMLYEICTGTIPFRGNNPDAIMMQQVNTIPASPSLINPNLSPALTTIIMRCIAKDPSARFPTAASLAAALQEASNISVSQNTGQPAYTVDAMDMPTIRSTRLTPLPAGMTPSGSSLSSSHPSMPISGSSGQSGVYSSNPPSYNVVATSAPTRPVTDTPSMGSSQPYSAAQSGGPTSSMQPPPTPPSKKPRKRGLLIALVALLLLAVVGSSLAAYFAFFSKGTTTGSSTVGHTYFISSGLLSPNSRQGITDQIQINLGNIPPPQSGKSYYAWLLNDRTLEWRPILLGKLTVNNGNISLSYPGDTFHSNLLATNSRFLITEEDATITPLGPSLDPAAWRYYAEFSQTKPNPADPKSYSLYDHIRHLLADDPKVKAAGLTGGLDIWLYRNTQKILEWAGSARDSWKNQNPDSSAFIHRQLTRIIDYLDGSTYAQQDLPGQNLLVDSTIAKIGLLTFDPAAQDPPGYLYHIGRHLGQMIGLPQITAGQKALASQINQAVNQVNLWFQTMHDEVLRVYHMPDTQLFGDDGRSLLDDIAALANKAFAGQINPNARLTDGVVQIHYNIQKIATFDVRACTTSAPCAL